MHRAETNLKNRESTVRTYLSGSRRQSARPFADHRCQIGPLAREAEMAQGECDLALDGREPLFSLTPAAAGLIPSSLRRMKSR